MAAKTQTALGVGWRPQLAWAIEKRHDIGWIELLAENLDPQCPVSRAVAKLKERGVNIALHGVSLSLGGADPPDSDRIKRLGELALATGATLISEHLAFVRSAGLETGHLLPCPRTKDAVEIVAENIRIAKEALPVPLAVENIASLFRYREDVLSEAEYLTQVIETADCLLLLDVSNLYANSLNYGFDAVEILDHLPLDRIAYVHIAGGVKRMGFYHDTHAHPIGDGVLNLLLELVKRASPPMVLLERDDGFSAEEEFYSELDAINEIVAPDQFGEPSIADSGREPAPRQDAPYAKAGAPHA